MARDLHPLQQLSQNALLAASGLQYIQSTLEQFIQSDHRGNDIIIEWEDKILALAERLRETSAVANKLMNGRSVHDMLHIGGDTGLHVTTSGRGQGKGRDKDTVSVAGTRPEDVASVWTKQQLDLLKEASDIFSQWETYRKELPIHAGNATPEAKALYNTPEVNENYALAKTKFEDILNGLEDYQLCALYPRIIEDMLPQGTRKQFSAQMKDISLGGQAVDHLRAQFEQGIGHQIVKTSSAIRTAGGQFTKEQLIQHWNDNPPPPAKVYRTEAQERARDDLQRAQSRRPAHRSPMEHAQDARNRRNTPPSIT